MPSEKRAYKRADGSVVYFSDSDVSLESYQKGGKGKEKRKQSLLSKILAIIFLILQSLILVVGVTVTGIGILIWKGLHDRQLDADPAIKSLPNYLIGGGIAIVIFAIIAIIAACTRKRRLGFFYIVITSFLIGAQIYALIQLKRLEGHVKEYFSRKWDLLQPVSRLGVQMWRGCCGFEGESDRSQVPCPDNFQGGCWTQISGRVRELQITLTNILYGSIAGHIALIIIMLIILLV